MSVDRSFRAAVGWILPYLVAWAVLAALWNFGGAWQAARGLPSPGPTASALVGVVGAFVQDPALWPSELWRWAGIVLNGVGFVAAVAALIAFIRWKAIR